MKRNFLWKIVVGSIVMLLPFVVFASKPPDDAQKDRILKKAYRMQIPFIENRGQIGNNDVSFYANTFGGTLFVEKNGILTYNLPFEDNGGVVIKEIFTDKRVNVKGSEPSPTKINYFKDKNKNKWKSNIPNYNSISLGEVYKGINLTLKAYGNNVEKLFTVLPGRNPDKIKVKLQGAKGLKVNEKGELEAITEHGTIKFTKPFAYQEIGSEKNHIEVAYAIQKGTTYGFKVGSYDKKRPLIIDPLLASTFIGGDLWESGYSLTLDETGNIYVVGKTASSEYPTTYSAYDNSYHGGEELETRGDVFISKLDSSLTSLLASTFIGGNDSDICHSIYLDEIGNIYVAGTTNSSDYPVTLGAYDETHNGSGDVFVSKLDSSLTSLLASTFIGGSDGGKDQGTFIILDETGNIYITGSTSSSGFPTTSGAYDESHNGSNDAFVSKLDSSLTSLLESTFIGGGDDDHSDFIADDKTGNIYITGSTKSSDFPTTSGAYNESINGDADVFVSKFDSSLTSLLASTFIGGSNSAEQGRSIALHENGNIYVSGYTDSLDYPTTTGAYDESFNGGGPYGDAFVSKLNSSLSILLASTFIGGDDQEIAAEFITLDGSGNVYITGNTLSSNYPTTPGAYDENFNGGWDVFISKFDSGLNFLLASTFIGGSEHDGGQTVVLDEDGNVYVTGMTQSSDFPTISGAYDESYNGGYEYYTKGDVFVSKLDGDLSNGTQPIPTLSEWGLIIFMTVMMGTGIMILRKRGMV